MGPSACQMSAIGAVTTAAYITAPFDEDADGESRAIPASAGAYWREEA